ncbi:MULTISPECIES: hypothetical protein [Micromonospora]|uniref:Uncharacterized protein n=1 Tax=Micromonospora yangpuensis TaxID=683228 RepID=A0A1C6U0V6_9ACTN|nr:hypothetical protein [Micromonospora yangpuensis]GGM11802.1 hypothetical protein GCM10012279_32410 [Micromonospora yangpuensis]SCL47511.1 hypothetical protein GA0070617_0603 [Micromonospora yangpuensis]
MDPHTDARATQLARYLDEGPLQEATTRLTDAERRAIVMNPAVARPLDKLMEAGRVLGIRDAAQQYRATYGKEDSSYQEAVPGPFGQPESMIYRNPDHIVIPPPRPEFTPEGQKSTAVSYLTEVRGVFSQQEKQLIDALSAAGTHTDINQVRHAEAVASQAKMELATAVKPLVEQAFAIRAAGAAPQALVANAAALTSAGASYQQPSATNPAWHGTPTAAPRQGRSPS